jgi:predicted CXXCH cytochrome family protein
MKKLALPVCVSLAVALAGGCSPAARYQVLSFLFDGVPAPGARNGDGGKQPVAEPQPGALRKPHYGEHGPYAARLCNGCHEPGATNVLVLPAEQLCFKCHDLDLGKKYVHGPIASGGCRVCHDPHSSQYRYLLVSASDTFCYHCHEREIVQEGAAHAGVNGQCTTCHDPHMSDRKYLLR